ncbi:MAG: Fur family transcriptional regulator [Candidatus Doudnabacteria bacterium]|nr:Fur family transcriptional regulator [Candidatus Doudnabacteria bacterium]
MEQIIGNLKNLGARITKTRFGLLDIFTKHNLPLAEPDIRRLLNQQGKPVNKTTIYRELEALKGYGVVTQVDFGDGKIRYELAQRRHHHHLVCVDCRKVEDVEINHDFSTVEKATLKNNRFKITRHSLEFFGLCQKCQK